jgi:glycosyltransferase involved in cell wall biosynthesis
VSRPRVSVIIPCYDLGAYLDEAVGSVLGQTYQDLEILIVDDGSTQPATVELLAGYRRPKTRILTAAHRGLAAARNRGILESAGEYLCALDADDRLAPGFLTRAVEVLDREPGIAFVSSWLEAFGEESWVWRQEACDLPALLSEDTVHTAALVRRSVLLEAGGYDEAMGEQGYEDWDLWLSIVERGHRGVILPEGLFYYRRRAGSMSSRCCAPAAHLGLVRYLLAKHEGSYRAHALEVLLRKEAERSRWLAAVQELEEELDARLAPDLESLHREAERLEARLRRVTAPGASGVGMAPREAALERALEAARGELAALRASASWRVTAPLRRAYGWLLRLGGGTP